jgi:hypothetical protein
MAPGDHGDVGEPADAQVDGSQPDGSEPGDSGEPDSGPAVGDAGGDAGMCTVTLPGLGMVGGACRQCARSRCASDITSAQSSCSAYIDCACQCGDTMSCDQSCRSQITSDCQTATMGIVSCAEQSCPLECAGPDGGVRRNPDGGLPLPDGGLVLLDGGTACSTLAACCGSLSGRFATECDAVANGGDETQCTNVLALAQDQGYCL